MENFVEHLLEVCKDIKFEKPSENDNNKTLLELLKIKKDEGEL